MKILFYRYHSICEPDWIAAFQALGIECVELDSKQLETKTEEERIHQIVALIVMEKVDFLFSINFFPSISRICEHMKKLYVSVSVDCPVLELYTEQIRNAYNRVFLFDYNQYESVIRYNPEGIFYLPLGTNIDHWDEVLHSEKKIESTEDTLLHSEKEAIYQYDISLVGSLYNEKSPYDKLERKLPDGVRGYCDGLLIAQENFQGLSLIEESIVDNSYHLEEEFKKIGAQYLGLSGMVQNMDNYVLLNEYFAQALAARDRKKLLEVLGQNQRVDLFTASNTIDVRGCINQAPKQKESKGIYVHGPVESRYEMPKIFYNSKINLNPTIRSIQTGLPQRVWDILGCGGFLLTNYQAELPEYFEIGKHLEAYETIEEAVEKCAYYLDSEHEEERKQIAKNGYELVRGAHSVYHRLQMILQMLVNETA